MTMTMTMTLPVAKKKSPAVGMLMCPRGLQLIMWLAWALLTLPLAQAVTPQHWTTAQGTRVYLVESPALPMLDVQVDFDAGSRRDPADRAGLAQLAAALADAGVTADAGQPALDENALAEAWADLGAQFGARASTDRLSFQLRSLTEAEILDGALDLAARQIATPMYPQPVLDRQVARASAAWREAQTRPGDVAQQRFGTAVHGSHPYGFSAEPDTLQRITREDLLAFHRTHLQRRHAVVSLVGAVDRAQAERIVQRLMQHLPESAGAGPAGATADALPTVAEVSDLAQSVQVRVPMASQQAHVLVGQPGVARGDPDFFALFVGNHILGGGGFVSRLTSEVREKRGLAYSVYSYFSPGLHRGPFVMGLQTRTDQADEALELVRETLRRFVADGPTPAELEAARSNLVGGFALRIDSNRKLLDHIAMVGFYGLPVDYLDTWREQVQAVTAEQVRDAFQRRIQPDRLVTVVVGGAAP